MLIFYIDEFGDHSLAEAPGNHGRLKKGVSEWFVLSAVGVRDTTRKPLAKAIFDLKSQHFGDKIAEEPWESSELKGRYLYRVARSVAVGKRLERPTSYKRLGSTHKVDNLLDDLDLVLAKFRPIIFAAAVDKKTLLKRREDLPATYVAQPPLGAAYAYLHQRVAFTMDQLYAGDNAILVADQQHQHEKYFRSGDMNAARDGLTSKLPHRPNFNLVLDKPLWIDTNLSTWDREILQLADIVAYSVGESLRRGSAPSEPCYLWDRITSLMAVHWSSGRIEAGGFAIYPKPERYPTT